MKTIKAIIIYASKYGFTEKCAQALAKKLDGTADLYRINAKKGWIISLWHVTAKYGTAV